MKKASFLWKVSVTTQPEAEDAVTESLQTLTGQPASAYTDAETGQTSTTVYLPEPPKNITSFQRELRKNLTQIAACGLSIKPGRVVLQKLRREDWANSWKRHFQPLEIGPVLLIQPSWSKKRPRAGQALVVLDPGLSFGTGQHPTTGFCLEQLVRASLDFRKTCFRSEKASGESSKLHRKLANSNCQPALLDIGTGSGILAIAAAKLGFSPIEAFDFDSEAVTAARGNIRKNRVSRKIKLTRQDLTRMPRTSRRKFDVVCANLISNLLIQERERILARLKPGGILILAGILKKEFFLVQHAYEAAGLRLYRSKTEKEWRSGAFVFAH